MRVVDDTVVSPPSVRRLLVALLAVLLGLPAVPASAAAGGDAGGGAGGGAGASAEPSGVGVAALVQTADGRLEVRRGKARTPAEARQLAGRWRAQRGIAAADVEVPVRAFDVPPPDPLQPLQWGLTSTNAEAAWQLGDAAGQVVAVVDSGVDLAHPDLSAVLVPGRDLVDGDDVPTDLNGHGTHVAGIVAGIAGNGVGIAGAALRSNVMPIRVLDANGSGYSSTVAEGVLWAADNGASVINLSLGGPKNNSVLEGAISYALGKGVTVVAAAGNEALNGDPVLYPAATPGVVAVGAVDSNDVRAVFSSTGAHLAVAAPGVGIVSTLPGGGYGSMSGTSMAAPFVAGAAALLKAAVTDVTPERLRTLIISTATDLGPVGHDPEYGAGLVDIGKARAAQLQATLGPPSAFVAVEPVRLLDTRRGYVPAASPKGRIGPGGTVAVRVAGASSSAGVVPADVSAVVLNVTAVFPTHGTHIAAYPAGAGPPNVSNLNPPAGGVVPNLVTVKVGQDGEVVLRNHAGSVDLVADLAGFYLPAVEGGAGQAFAAVPPTRVLDTRPGYLPTGDRKVGLGPGDTFDLDIAGRAGVHAAASAVVLNITGVHASTATVVRAYPTPPDGSSAVPAISTLNLVQGATNANLAVVQVGPEGTVRLRNDNGWVDVVVDVAGYFSPDAPALFVPVDPQRALDTRQGLGAPAAALDGGAWLDLALTGIRGLPAGATATVLNLTAVTPTTGTHLRTYPADGGVPNVSNLNVSAGETRANAVVVPPAGDGRVRIHNNAGRVHVVADLAGYYVVAR